MAGSRSLSTGVCDDLGRVLALLYPSGSLKDFKWVAYSDVINDAITSSDGIQKGIRSFIKMGVLPEILEAVHYGRQECYAWSSSVFKSGNSFERSILDQYVNRQAGDFMAPAILANIKFWKAFEQLIRLASCERKYRKSLFEKTDQAIEDYQTSVFNAFLSLILTLFNKSNFSLSLKHIVAASQVASTRLNATSAGDITFDEVFNIPFERNDDDEEETDSEDEDEETEADNLVSSKISIEGFLLALIKLTDTKSKPKGPFLRPSFGLSNKPEPLSGVPLSSFLETMLDLVQEPSNEEVKSELDQALNLPWLRFSPLTLSRGKVTASQALKTDNFILQVHPAKQHKMATTSYNKFEDYVVFPIMNQIMQVYSHGPTRRSWYGRNGFSLQPTEQSFNLEQYETHMKDHQIEIPLDSRKTRDGSDKEDNVDSRRHSGESTKKVNSFLDKNEAPNRFSKNHCSTLEKILNLIGCPPTFVSGLFEQLSLLLSNPRFRLWISSFDDPSKLTPTDHEDKKPALEARTKEFAKEVYFEFYREVWGSRFLKDLVSFLINADLSPVPINFDCLKLVGEIEQEEVMD